MTAVTFASLVGLTSTVRAETEQKTKNHIDVKTSKSKPPPAKTVNVAKERFHGDLRNDIIKVDQEKLSNKRAKIIDEVVLIKVTNARPSDEEFFLNKEEKRARIKRLGEKKRVRSIKRSRQRDAKSRLLKRDLYDHIHYDQKGYDLHGYNREGFDPNGYDPLGYDCYGYDREGVDRQGNNRYGYDEQEMHRREYAFFDDDSDDYEYSDEGEASVYDEDNCFFGVLEGPILVQSSQIKARLSQSGSSLTLLDRDDEELEREVLRQRVRHKGRC